MDREVKKNVADFAKFRAYLKKKTKKNSCLQSEFLILIKEIVWVLFENIDFHAWLNLGEARNAFATTHWYNTILGLC